MLGYNADLLLDKYHSLNHDCKTCTMYHGNTNPYSRTPARPEMPSRNGQGFDLVSSSSDPSLIRHSQDMIEPCMKTRPQLPPFKSQRTYCQYLNTRYSRTPSEVLTVQSGFSCMRGTNTISSRCCECPLSQLIKCLETFRSKILNKL